MEKQRKVVLITGASRGIGKAIATKFAQKNYDIVLNYNKSEKEALELTKKLKKEYNVSVLPLQADISDFDQIEKMVLLAIKNFKKIDVLVNNAGICYDCELKDRTVGQFVETFKTNVYGPFYLTKLIGDHMVENRFGKIINVSSNNSINQFYPTSIDYDASKCALNSLTKNFAIEYAPYVNVNAVAPGWIDTDMNKNFPKEFWEQEKDKILKKRIGTPEDVASLVFFLASDEADYINGEVIVIDGGMF